MPESIQLEWGTVYEDYHAELDAAEAADTQAAVELGILPTFSAGDIPLARAVAAHAGSSFVPEKRGAARRAEYVAHLEEVRDQLAPLATTPELVELLAAELERYRDGFRARYLAALDADARTVSPMIAGPSNFPTRRMEKRLSTARNRWQEVIDFEKRGPAAIRTKLRKAAGLGPISSDAPDALQQLEQKIAKLEAEQERMKAANAVVRKKKRTDDEKRADLVALGFSEKVAAALLEPDYAGRLGFPAFELTNNNANIRRLKQRLAGLERDRADRTTEEPFAGGRIVDNVEDNRVQLFFDDKPDAATRAALKARGFRWAPSVGAWQRQRGTNALYVARQIVGA